jgi:hypothetical protein
MKAVELAAAHEDSCCNIAIALTTGDLSVTAPVTTTADDRAEVLNDEAETVDFGRSV